MGRPGYPAEFRRKVLDLLAEGRSVASVAHDLDVSDQSIYHWRRQDRVNAARNLAGFNRKLRNICTQLRRINLKLPRK